MINKIDHNLSRYPFKRRVILVLLISILGFIDFATGFEYSFAVFYLIPVSIAAWYDTQKTTIVTIIASGLTWLSADYSTGHNYSNAIIPYWNAFVRLGFFSVVAYLLWRVRRNLAEMTQMAMQDSLTALNNSRAFRMKYQLLRNLGLRKKMQVALGIVDLDGFKAVNDQHGHSQGDEVLVEFAHVLQHAARNTDVVARMGGDEFAVMLLQTDQIGAQQYDQRLRALFSLSGLKRNYGVDFSMGIQVFDELPENMDDATRLADQLMYRSKQLGKSQTSISCI